MIKKREKSEEAIGRLLKKSGCALSVAESCTGGLLSHKITDIPGSSDYFMGGIVAYSNDLKKKILKVHGGILRKFGAVSKETAIAMARGARENMGSDIATAITGIAGPAGGSKAKPVGTVFIAITGKTREENKRFLFKGTREAIKLKASNKALKMLEEFISTKRYGKR